MTQDGTNQILDMNQRQVLHFTQDIMERKVKRVIKKHFGRYNWILNGDLIAIRPNQSWLMLFDSNFSTYNGAFTSSQVHLGVSLSYYILSMGRNHFMLSCYFNEARFNSNVFSLTSMKSVNWWIKSWKTCELIVVI